MGKRKKGRRKYTVIYTGPKSSVMNKKVNKAVVGTLTTVAILFSGAGLKMIGNPTLGYIFIGIGAVLGWSALLFSGLINFKSWQKIIGYVVIIIMALIWALLQLCGILIPANKPDTNPEAKENKYVRIKKVSSPDMRFTSAMLIEFGVNKLSSEGLAIVVHFTGDTYEDWYGEPGRTDKQNKDVQMQYDGQLSPTNPFLKLSHETFKITPRKSYYLCIMSSKEIAEPNDVLYFAVVLNERTQLSPQRERLGHQYYRR